MSQQSQTALKRPEKAKQAAPHPETKEHLRKAKEKLNPKEKVSHLVQEFFKDFKELSAKERIKRIGEILATAAIGILFSGKESVKKIRKIVARDESRRRRKEIAEHGDETFRRKEDKKKKEKEKCIDPCLVGEIPEGEKPVIRKTKDIHAIAEDHQHNAQLLEILPKHRGKLDKLLKLYESNKERYERVADATDFPPILIFAIHFMEGSCNFKGYLHNGQKLGKPTTYVPKGILFRQGEWEEAAIHALGGDIKDANGKPSRKTFQRLRKKLGIHKDTTDMGKLMAFTERYNGLGYRNRGLRSCYVYGGTNLLSPGRYVADHEFNPNSISRRLGTAAIMMAGQAKEAGQELRVAQNNKLFPSHGKGVSRVAYLKPGKPEKPDSQGKPVKLGTHVARSRRGVGGTYDLEHAKTPSGYTRRVSGKVPAKTAIKLRKIADQLLADKKMKKFTGIPMVVDGYDVMMVKEEHMHSMKKYGQEGLADHYYKPHTGVSYLLKKQGEETKLAA